MLVPPVFQHLDDSNLALVEASSPNMDPIFFQLPAEVRNMIYEFVLTHERGVFARITADMTPVPQLFVNTGSGAIIPRDIEANMLKHVCRQMHQETRQLSLLFNDLIFRRSGSTSALSVCEQFLTAVPAPNHGMIKKIEIIETERENSPVSTSHEFRSHGW